MEATIEHVTFSAPFDSALRYFGQRNVGATEWWARPGEPVATSQLFLDGLVAGVYVVATAPWARRRGIGTGMTIAALRDARTLGYRTAVLQASPMGFPVYRRLGFQEVCRMTHWEWGGTSERSF